MNSERATDKQLKYARDLGLQFPADISKSEMSDLLEYHLSDDARSSEDTRRFARWFGFTDFTDHVGERELYDRLMEWLQ